MDNSGEGVDDQGSGWLQVKKKHRSSAKFSAKSCAGGFSGKNDSTYQLTQPSSRVKSRNSYGNRRSQISKKGANPFNQVCGDFASCDCQSNATQNGVLGPVKLFVEQDGERSKISKLPKSLATNSTARVEDTQRSLQKDKPDAVQKIKWGDLEDDVLALHHENHSRADTVAGDAKDNTLVSTEHGNDFNSVSCVSSSSNPLENQLMMTPVDADSCPDQTFPFTLNEGIIIGENCKEVSKVSSQIAEVPTMNGHKVAQNDVSVFKNVQSEHFKPTNNEDLSSIPPSGEDSGKVVKIQVPAAVCEIDESSIYGLPCTSLNSADSEKDSVSLMTGDSGPEISNETGIMVRVQLPVVSAVNKSNIPELASTSGNSGMVVISQDSKLFLPNNDDDEVSREPEIIVKLQLPVVSEVNESQISEVSVVNRNSITVVKSLDDKSLASERYGPEILGESTLEIPVEDPGCLPLNSHKLGETAHDEAQNLSSLVEGDTSESRERFRQRLWCFLFENLNRAVDELYLLCELECDVEQMKEAILVLEEASSDFKDLTTRVHGFDKVKRAHSHSIDGAPITLKSDHRRPHALSWEVRRITTSPHRAEILSSSLEAFKKIQQERASKLALGDAQTLGLGSQNKPSGRPVGMANSRDAMLRLRKKNGGSDPTHGNVNGEMRNLESGRSNKVNFVKNGVDSPHNLLSSDVNTSRLPSRDTSVPSGGAKSKREADTEKLLRKKEKILSEFSKEKTLKSTDDLKKQIPSSEKDRERRNSAPWKSMDAWKEKRNWEDILSSPFRVSSRISHSPGISRKSAERARILHDKLMSSEKKKKTAWDLKKEAEEKHARAMRIRSELENERVQKLQRTSEKLNRVNEWQAVRTMKLREGMYARHQRGESRHVAFIAKVVRRAGDESSKVNEVRFITSLNEENKKLILRQKLQDSELRRAEKLQVIKTKQKEDMAREEAVLERRRVIEAEKLQRLAETQRKKEEAQVRREEERKASSAAREARAIEQLRRREERAKAQQEEAELLAQKLAERLSESEQRRKFYLEQIRERASMDFRDQSSPLLRRSLNKEGQGRITPTNNGDYLENSVAGTGASAPPAGNVTLQHSLKRRIKKIRQRLMALKYEFTEPPFGSENAGIGYRTSVGTARVKVGRWLQELQRLRQARKEGAANIGLITADMIKFLDGKDPELQASRQAGLLDFISSALPASHTTKPEACQVTVHLLKLLKVVLTAPANRSYFLAQNLLPPIIPMLSAALENYIKIAASLNVPGIANITSSKTSVESFESISEVLDNFLWVVGAVVGHTSSDGRELQMRDGLVELLIAYQVIHRLRDLFALYDRPQVEGSPFPPSILLSIQLLVFVTHRPSSKSSINWESSPIQSMQGFDSREKQLSEVADSGYSSLSMASEDYRLPLSVLNGTTIASAPDVLEDRSLDDLYKMNKGDESVVDGEGDEKKPSCSSVDLTNANTSMDGIQGESHELSGGLKDARHLVNVGVDQKNDSILTTKQPAAFLLSAMSETGLVSLPSLLTAVLLQANNRLSSSEQGTYVLPSNFEEVATGVLKVLNNLALLDVTSIQRMLARPDLRMEFFHLMSFLLSYCTSKWKVASDQVGLLLLESLLLLGYFALFHPENQAVLRWGKSPTILHKVCDLPFVFFSDPELMPVLAGTLVAACYGCVQNKGVVQQELSMDMLLSLLRSCRNVQALRFSSLAENFPTDDPSESNQLNSEPRKSQGDIISIRSNRFNGKSTRSIMGKGAGMGNSTRASKMRSLRDFKALKASEELALKHNALAPETSTMLHRRFPSSFIDRAENFFSEGK